MASQEEFYFKKFNSGWIFYDDKNNSDTDSMWENVRKAGCDDAKAAYDFLSQTYSKDRLSSELKEYSKTIELLASNEKEKENRIMKEIYGVKGGFDSYEGAEFLRKFNENLIGEDRFLATIKRLEVAIKKGGKLRAPSQSVNFVSNFTSELNKELETMYQRKVSPEELMEMDWKAFIKECGSRAIDRTFTDFEKKNALFGGPEDYVGLAEEIKTDKNFWDFIQSYLKVEEIQQTAINKFIENEKRKSGEYKGKNNRKLKEKKIKINDAFKIVTEDNKLVKNELFDRMIGGLLHEFEIIKELQLEIGEKGTKVSSSTIKSNIGTTDGVVVASKKYTIDLEKIMNAFQEAMDGGSQPEIASSLKKLEHSFEGKKYSNVFVIFTSSKLYSLGDSFRGFHKTAKVADITKLIDEMGFDSYTWTPGGKSRFGSQLVSVYLNEMNGATLGKDEYREDTKRILTILLAAQAAKLLFSDSTLIGQLGDKNTQKIHLFDLDGVIIPLSTILYKLARAFKDFNGEQVIGADFSVDNLNIGKLSIRYPKGKEFKKGEGRYGLGNSDKINFNECWRQQRDEAKSKATFRIRFATDFKKQIQEIINTYK